MYIGVYYYSLSKNIKGKAHYRLFRILCSREEVQLFIVCISSIARYQQQAVTFNMGLIEPENTS